MTDHAGMAHTIGSGRPPRGRRGARSLLAGAVAASLVVAPGVVGPAAASADTYRIRIINSTGNDPSRVFVSLTDSQSQSKPTLPNGMTFNEAYPLAATEPASTQWIHEGDNAYAIDVSGEWTSGAILYSIATEGSGFDGYDTQPTVGTNDYQYDFSELTFDQTNTFNGDISAVNQIGIPARLSILRPDGTVAHRNGSDSSASEYVGCVDATRSVMDSSITGWDPQSAGIWRQNGEQFLQLAGPGAASLYQQYPSFEQYVKSMAGQTLTIKGYFAGGQTAGAPAYYAYSGEVATDGSVFLTGGLYDNADQTGASGYPTPAGIYIPGEELYGHDPSTWLAGTGYGIYAQNGPYTVASTDAATLTGGQWVGVATQPPADAADFISSATPGWVVGQLGTYEAVGNDIYGWIYGDLVVSFAMGYVGSDATGSPIYDSSRWNTNPPATPNPSQAPWSDWWTAGGLPAYEAAWTSSVAYARYNVYQNATQTTGTTYGMSLGDRFAPTGTQSPEMGVTNEPASGSFGTWQVELLSKNGCADPLAISQTEGPAAGGQPVTITGRNIYPGATVTFNGSSATAVDVELDPVSGLSTLAAVTPAQPAGTQAAVVVTNPNGNAIAGVDSAAVPGGYRYTGASGPPVDPNPSSTCAVPIVKAAAAKKRLKVRKWTVVVKSAAGTTSCQLSIQATSLKKKAVAQIKTDASTGQVKVRALKKKAAARVTITSGDSPAWSRTWRS